MYKPQHIGGKDNFLANKVLYSAKLSKTSRTTSSVRSINVTSAHPFVLPVKILKTKAILFEDQTETKSDLKLAELT